MSQSSQNAFNPAAQSVDELWTVQNSATYLLPKLQSMKESNPHLTILDVNAGSGIIAISFAKIIPDGHVTAAILKPSTLPRKASLADSAGVKNITFQQVDAYKLPFPDGTFDITHCHQMLCHLKEPVDALREMLRVTKPGGVVAAREGDQEMECIWPEIPALLQFHGFISKLMQASGGSSTAGRQLLDWAVKAGVERKKITATYGAWSYNEPEDKNMWAQEMAQAVRGGRAREGALAAGLVTAESLEEMGKAWDEWAEKDEASLGMIQGEILIQK